MSGSEVFDADTVIEALHRLHAAGVRDSYPDPSRVVLIGSTWHGHERMGSFTHDQIIRCVDAWLAAQKSGAVLKMPTPAMLLMARADQIRGERRAIEAQHGGQIPEAVKAERGEFRGWVDRVFGREWGQQGQRYRAYMTAADHPKHGSDIPKKFVDAGYTVELPVPANRSPDSVGMAWVGRYKQDLSHFGAPRVTVSARVERGRRQEAT